MKIIRTPPWFSIGMDDWLTDIEYDQDDQEPETPNVATHLTVQPQESETPGDQAGSSGDDIDDDILACCDVEDSMFGPLIVPSQDHHWQPS